MSYHIEAREKTVTDTNGKIKTVKVYRGIVELPKGADGKRHRKKTPQFTRIKDAKAAAEALEDKYLKGSLNADIGNITVAQLCTMFLENTATLNQKETTIENYRKVIKNHIVPAFAGYKVQSLNYDLMQNFINNLNEKGYKYNTIDRIKCVFSVILEFAQTKKRIISYNPMRGVAIPKQSKNNHGLTTQNKNDYIEPEAMKKIFARFPEGNVNFIPIVLGYKCGCRDAEAYAVTWDDIDFEEGTLYINKQVQCITETNPKTKEKSSYWTIMPPKYDSYRTINLDAETLDILRREKIRQDTIKSETEDEDYDQVYFNGKELNYDNGEPMDFVIKFDGGGFKSPNTRQHIADVIHHELNLPFTYHSLRHTHATILAEGGLSPMDIRDRLGHKNINVTLKYYTHSTKGTRMAAQPKLEEIMRRTCSSATKEDINRVLSQNKKAQE